MGDGGGGGDKTIKEASTRKMGLEKSNISPTWPAMTGIKEYSGHKWYWARAAVFETQRSITPCGRSACPASGTATKAAGGVPS